MPVADAASRAPILHAIHRARNLTWHYDRALVRPLTPYHHAADRSRSRDFRLWVWRVWRGRYHAARAAWRASPTRASLLCIHAGEGAWTDPGGDPGTDYYGGLQMDASFASTYAPTLWRVKGTPDHWTPLEQLTAGARAVSVRGYAPWPLTRIPCGV